MLSSKNYRAPFFLLFPCSSFSGSKYCRNRTFVSFKDKRHRNLVNPASVTSIVIIVARHSLAKTAAVAGKIARESRCLVTRYDS